MATRGVLALGLAAYAFFVDGFARNEWLALMALPWIVVGLCAYGLLDGVLVIWMGWNARRRFCAVTAVQGMATIGAALALLTVLFVRVHMEWFAIFAAVQCLVVGSGELIAGRRLFHHRADMTAFLAAGTVSFIFAMLLLTVAHDSTHTVAQWLMAYGIGMCMTHLWMSHRVREWRVQAHRTAQAVAA